MIPYHRVAGQFFNQPLLLAPEAANTISAFLLSRVGTGRSVVGVEDDSARTMQAFRPTENQGGSIEFHSPRANRFHGEVALTDDGRPLPYRLTPDGAAIITLVGEFVNRGAWIGANSGLISYEGLKHQLATAATDPRTSAIILDIESPGGEAMGGFEAAAAVRAAAEQKPVIAVVNGMAASAAYAIASGATKIVTMGTGIAGSIGVVLLHLELSEYMHNQGIEPTLIFAGEHKVDGNPFEPLPESVRADMQAKVLSYYDDFVETILAGRKSLTAKAIRATGARIFKGREAVAAGLADEVGTLEEVLANLSTLRSRSAPSGRPSVTSTHGGTHTMAPEEQNAAASIPAETATTLVSPVVTAPAGGPTVAVATAPPQVVTPSPVATSLTTDECAELASIGAGAARLGVNVDVVAAIRQGVKPDALRKQVLDAAATRDEGSAIVTAAPAQASPPPAGQSAIVARAREVAAASGAKQQRH